VVVIGSGMGGLAAASILSAAGKRVLVLEQAGKIGGCLHVFKSGGYEFDTGLHYVSGAPPLQALKYPILRRGGFPNPTFSVSSSAGGEQSVATPHAARGWVRPPYRHIKIQSCFCPGSAFDVAAFQMEVSLHSVPIALRLCALYVLSLPRSDSFSPESTAGFWSRAHP
jgi:hypothetical protein